MARGYLALLLHAHLPYVRHPEHERFLEENWLFEAITECYIPLLQALTDLSQNPVPFRLTLSLSPTLISMLQDELLQARYLKHMETLIQLAKKETQRKHADQRTQAMADFYLQFFQATRLSYLEDYQTDLLNAFKRLQLSGHLEIITTAATHGFLPLLRNDPGATKSQLAIAADTHKENLGQAARGIWLPECGYYPGLEEELEQQGFRYFIVDSHGLLNATERPWHGIAAPLACPNGVAAFGRDPDSSKQVWSAQEGYPGDPWYREFHQDIGFDLPVEALAPFIQDDDSRTHTGIKYFRVTHQGQYKQPYEPSKARERVAIHAEDFFNKRQQGIHAHAMRMERPPILVAPYDAELFGHWWYEGPQWLQQLISRFQQQNEIELISPFDYLSRHPTLQCAQPSSSSWGELGYSAYWLNEQTDWIYPHLHRAAQSMQQLLIQHQPRADSSNYRALQQAGRSLLLAQASDWPFILKSGTGRDYAEQRIRDLLARFHYLEKAIQNDEIDLQHLQALEQMDAIFPNLDLQSFMNSGES